MTERDVTEVVSRLLDWLDHDTLARERAHLLRLLASARVPVVTAAAGRLSRRPGVPAPPVGWAGEVAALLRRADASLPTRRRLRRACLTEAARSIAAQRPARPADEAGRRPTKPGVRRYGPPPRLAGCRGKTVRWRTAPASR